MLGAVGSSLWRKQAAANLRRFRMQKRGRAVGRTLASALMIAMCGSPLSNRRSCRPELFT